MHDSVCTASLLLHLPGIGLLAYVAWKSYARGALLTRLSADHERTQQAMEQIQQQQAQAQAAQQRQAQEAVEQAILAQRRMEGIADLLDTALYRLQTPPEPPR